MTTTRRKQRRDEKDYDDSDVEDDVKDDDDRRKDPSLISGSMTPGHIWRRKQMSTQSMTPFKYSSVGHVWGQVIWPPIFSPMPPPDLQSKA